MNKTYYMPTKILMGENTVKENAHLFNFLGKKCMLVTGKHSAALNGSLSDVTDVLKANGQDYILFDKIMNNPTIDVVCEGAEIAKTEKVDFIVSMGGGSPMDAAKAIALLACQNYDKSNLFSGNYTNNVLPMIFVPTTAGTGSEVTPYAILTDDVNETKTTLSTPAMFPDYALLDGKYMTSLNKANTINTAVDALSHAIEGSLSVKSDVVTDTLALKSMQMISDEFDNLKNHTHTITSRTNLLYASTLAGMVIANTGTVAVHGMGYSLTYCKNIPHGRANGLLLGEFLSFVSKTHSEKVEEMLKAMNLKNVDEFKNKLRELLEPVEKLTEEEINKYAEKAIKKKNIRNCVAVPKLEDLKQILSKI